MNLLLHGLGSITGEALIDHRDALIADPGDRWSVVLANPPFGRSSSTDIGGAEDDGAEIFRQDFVVTTSNKQLNFLQHIMTILDINGRAGVVLPDNVLFEGGAGETLRRRLLTAFDFHTLLRLPTGIFYKPGVKANVLFFDKKPAAEQPWTQRLWVYDLRTNKHFTLKKNPLRRDDLDDFVAVVPAGQGTRRAGRVRAVEVVHLRRADRPRQGEPRHHLAARRVPRRRRQPPGSGGHRPRDRRGPDRRPRRVRGRRRRAGSASSQTRFWTDRWIGQRRCVWARTQASCFRDGATRLASGTRRRAGPARGDPCPESARAAEPDLDATGVVELVESNTGVPTRLIDPAVRYWTSCPDSINAWIAEAERSRGAGYVVHVTS